MLSALEEEKVNQPVMDQIILGVAHELNNPNTFVRMNAMNLKKMMNLLGPALDEYQKNHPEAKFGPFTLSELRAKMISMNEAILGATIRIISIADKLKQCSAHAMGQSSVVSLLDLVKSVAEMHRFLLDRFADLEIVAKEGETYTVAGHALQLEQALSILLTNACDAISDKLKGSQEKGKIRITLKQTDAQVILLFRDSGCGMDAELMKKVFAPYFTTKPQGVGDGLGLALCRAVLDRHSGSIDVTSQQGEWTEFVVTLPRHRS